MKKNYNQFKNILMIVVMTLFIGNIYAQNTTISGANTFSMALCSDGFVYTWGKNHQSQMALPANNTAIYSVPTKVVATGFPAIKAVDAGSGSTAYALDFNGTLWSWGENEFGQTGTGLSTGSPVSVPTTVKMGGTALTNVAAVSGGNQCAYALMNDGTVVSWGNDTGGEMGRGLATTGINSTGFVKINATTQLTNIIQIDAFDNGCIGLDKDGYVWTWGPANDGQLGYIATNGYAQKVNMLNNSDGIFLSDIVKISAGDKHGLAIDNFGYLWSWGANWGKGQLGRGTTTGASITYANRVLASDLSTCPAIDQGGNFLTKVKDIAAGQASSIALLEDGTVVSWGAVYFYPLVSTNGGLLGQGPGALESGCPKSVYKNATTKLTNITSVSDGDGWYFAKDASGATWCWGANLWIDGIASGLLGLGASTTANQLYAVLNSNLPATCNTYPSCPALSITGLPSILCSNDLKSYTLTGTPAGGTFSGTGVSGNVFNPNGLATGVYTVKYTYNSVPLFCPKVVTANVYIPPAAQLLQNVISIGANTFTDGWPTDAEVKDPVTDAYYLKGIKGSWIPEEQYAYVDDRQQGAVINTKLDGLIQNVPMYNWNYTTNDFCYPNWRKINTITQVANGTGQLENKDILKNYSAALYGYNDQLSLAVAANAEYQEICYEGFEEYQPGQTLSLWGLSKGNFTVINNQPTIADKDKNLNFAYEIKQGINNAVEIMFPSNRASELVGKSVLIFGASISANTVKNIHGYYKINSSVAGIDANTCNIVFNAADFKFQGYWKGKISIPTNLKDLSPSFTFTTPVSIVNVFPTDVSRKGHTGKQFLKVMADAAFEQVNMQLLAGQNYILSTWLSTDDVNASSYDYAGRGISISFKDNAGSDVGTPVILTLAASGNIIEGWQRLEGQFTMPATATRFIVKFLTPNGTATYFDDIRIFPADGNIQSYVYNKSDYKLNAVLDQNNYATYYYYDESGSLYLLKKETEKGVMTIQESYSHITEINKQ